MIYQKIKESAKTDPLGAMLLAFMVADKFHRAMKEKALESKMDNIAKA